MQISYWMHQVLYVFRYAINLQIDIRFVSGIEIHLSSLKAETLFLQLSCSSS